MTKRPNSSTSKPVKSRRRTNHSANGKVKPASVSRRARNGTPRRGRTHSNGHAGRNGQARAKGTRARANQSKLNLKAAMGMLAAAASGLAHSAVAENIKHQTAEKFTTILEKSKRSLSHLRSQAAKTFGAPSASRSSGRRARGAASNNGNGRASQEQGAPSSEQAALANPSAN